MGWFGFSSRADPSVATPTNLVGQLAGYSQSSAPVGTKARKVVIKNLMAQWGSNLIRKITRRKHDIRAAEGQTGRFVLYRKGDPAALRLDLVGKLSSVRAGSPRSDVQADPPGAGEGGARAVGDDPVGASRLGSSAVAGDPPAQGLGVANAGAGAPGTEEALAHQQLSDRIRARDELESLKDVRVADILSDFKQLSDPAIAAELDPTQVRELREALALQLLRVKFPEAREAFFPPNAILQTLGLNYFEDIDEPIGEREDRFRQLGGQLVDLAASAAEGIDAASAREAPDIARARSEVAREFALATSVRQLATRYQNATTAALDPARFISELAERLGRLTSAARGTPPELIDRLCDQARLMGSRADTSAKGATRTLLPGDALQNMSYLVGILDDLDYDPVKQSHSALQTGGQPLSAERQAMERLEGFATFVDGLIGGDGYLDEARLNLVKTMATNDAQRTYAEARHELQKSVRSLSRLFDAAHSEGSIKKFKTTITPFMSGSRIKVDRMFLNAITNQAGLKQNMPEVNLLLANVMLRQFTAEKLRRGEEPALLLGGTVGDLEAVFADRDLKDLGFSVDDIKALRTGDGGATWRSQAQELANTVRSLSALGMSRSAEVTSINEVVEGARKRLLDNSLATRNLSELVGNGARAEALITLTGNHAAERSARLQHLTLRERDKTQGAEYALAAAAISRSYDGLSELATLREQAAAGIAAHAARNPAEALNAGHAATRKFAAELTELRDTDDMLASLQSLKAKLEEAATVSGSDSVSADLARSRTLISNFTTARQASLSRLIAIRSTPLHEMVFPTGQDHSAEAVLLRVKPADHPADSPSPGDLADWVHTTASAPSREKLYRNEIREHARVQTRLLEARQRELNELQRLDLRMALVGAAAKCLTESRSADLPEGDETAVALWDHRARFIELLEGSGLDTQRFAPEIEDMLLREITAEALKKWLGEANKLPLPVVSPTTALADAPRAVIAAELPNMKDGDRVFLKSNRCLEVGLNRVPVGAGLRVDAAVAGGTRNMMVIQRKPNSFVINVRAGTTGAVRLGLSAGLMDAPIVRANARAHLNTSDVAGYAIEITAEGNNPRDFINALLSGQKLTPKELALAKDIKALTKTELKATLDASISAGYSPISPDSMVGVGVGGQLQLEPRAPGR